MNETLQWHLESIGYPHNDEMKFPDGKPSPKAYLLSQLRASLKNHCWTNNNSQQCDILIGSVDHIDPSVSAMVTKVKDDYFIGILTPVFSATIEILLKLTSHLKFDENCSNPEANEPLSTGAADQKIKVTNAGIPLTLPTSDAHLQFASFLQRIAIEFLYYHELQHVLMGHLGKHEAQFSSPTLAEKPTANLTFNKEQRAMEAYADYVAASTIAQCCLRNNFVLCPTAVIPPQNVTPDHLFKYSLFSILTIFLIFESQQKARAIESANYPSVATRILITLEAFRAQLSSTATHGINTGVIEIWKSTITEISLAFSRSNLNNPILKWFAEIQGLESYYSEYYQIMEDAEEFRNSWLEYQITATQ